MLTGTSVPERILTWIARRCVIGIAVAAPAIVVVIEPRPKTPAAREMPNVADVAAGLGKVLARNAGSEGAGAADMACSKAPTQTGAAAQAADMGTAETADMSAAQTADMRAAEAAPHVRATPEAASVASSEPATVASSEPATVTAPTSSAARERVGGQSRAERGSRRQDDHGLT